MYRWSIQKHSMFLPILLCPWLPEQKCIKRAAWREKDNTIPLEVFQRATSHHSGFMKRRRKGENCGITKVLYPNLTDFARQENSSGLWFNLIEQLPVVPNFQELYLSQN